jgi:hypothetical protein
MDTGGHSDVLKTAKNRGGVKPDPDTLKIPKNREGVSQGPCGLMHPDARECVDAVAGSGLIRSWIGSGWRAFEPATALMVCMIKKTNAISVAMLPALTSMTSLLGCIAICRLIAPPTLLRMLKIGRTMFLAPSDWPRQPWLGLRVKESLPIG